MEPTAAHSGPSGKGPAHGADPEPGAALPHDPSHARGQLGALLGHWRGITELAAPPGGQTRQADAELSFTRAAGGYAVVQSYRHREPDGTHFEGHGVFTVDPDRGDTLWYFVDSMDRPPEAPARGTWHGDTLVVERQGPRGTSRHTFRVDGGVLTHTADLRLGDAVDFTPVLRSVCRPA